MIKIGKYEIHRIEEVVLREKTALFADWNETAVDPIRDWFVGDYYSPESDSFTTSIHSWLIRGPDLTILIDTAGGNDKPRPASPRFDHAKTPFLANLASAGVQPDDVDYVLLTHLHIDHVGWNTKLVDGEWRPTFKNAVYVMSETELEWRDPEKGAKGKSADASLPFVDSVQPILDQAQVRIVKGDEKQFLPDIDFVPIPGHAPGMMAVRLQDQGDEALFIADVMHQPIQVYNPEWSSRYCEDQALASKTRADILAYAAETGCLVLPAHFGGSHCGYIDRDGEGYSYRPSKIAP